uniref:NADH-ubiquinone oxidoreductase chain 5 n=1 Tax=Batrachomoeus trispinosus TaxID=262770 RepID=Q5GM99_9TELE|nr:NADH dehydrogenase subunit 5 [Batrachomoeus trispinosus]
MYYTLIVTTSFLTMLMLMLSPLIISTIYKTTNDTVFTKAIKAAFLISLLPLCIFIDQGIETTTSSLVWMDSLTHSTPISFKLDLLSLLFCPVALFVSWAILEYTLWYMHQDPNINTFMKYLLTFLVTMIILVTANNVFQLFIGWEGVGIMSFLLIGWWHGRADANTAAMQAIIYNCIGDLGLIFMLAWTAIFLNTWDFTQLFYMSQNHDMTTPLLALVLAASGKSAQFGLHPWLPAAMEGPTPVSALLHSSTMVVAGVFLMIRTSPIMTNHPMVLSTCLCLGAMTTMFTAACALTQNDIKKIVAFSTSSQLGLMMVAIGLNMPHLAFFHICTHAFFKAMLFLCSGSIIHCLNNEQDIRKMGGMFKTAPLTSSCLTLGTLALAGFPFLAGFYSKDPILETMNNSHINSWAILLTLVATTFTAIYSLRMLVYVNLTFPRHTPLPPLNENFPNLMNPLKRLAWGSVIAGFVIFSHILPTKPPILTMPTTIKLTTLFLLTIGLLSALQMSSLFNKKTPFLHSPSNWDFFTLLGFFPQTFHRMISKTTLRLGHLSASLMLDLTWTEKLGPQHIAVLNKNSSNYTSNLQRGYFKTSSLMFLLTILLAITSQVVQN